MRKCQLKTSKKALERSKGAIEEQATNGFSPSNLTVQKYCEGRGVRRRGEGEKGLPH